MGRRRLEWWSEEIIKQVKNNEYRGKDWLVVKDMFLLGSQILKQHSYDAKDVNY